MPKGKCNECGVDRRHVIHCTVCRIDVNEGPVSALSCHSCQQPIPLSSCMVSGFMAFGAARLQIDLCCNNCGQSIFGFVDDFIEGVRYGKEV